MKKWVKASALLLPIGAGVLLAFALLTPNTTDDRGTSVSQPLQRTADLRVRVIDSAIAEARGGPGLISPDAELFVTERRDSETWDVGQAVREAQGEASQIFSAVAVDALKTLTFVSPMDDYSEIEIPVRLTSTMCPDGCDRDALRIDVLDSSIKVSGSPLFGSKVRVYPRRKQVNRPTERTQHLLDMERRIERTEELLAQVENPAVRLSTLEAKQQGTDFVIQGTGKNVGESPLASLIVRAEVRGEIDGVRVRVPNAGFLDNEVPVGAEFNFELYFYGTQGARPVSVWFVLDDLEDFENDNDPVVPSAVSGAELSERIVLP